MTENLARANVSGQHSTRLSMLRALLRSLAQYSGTSYRKNKSTSPARMHKGLRRGDKQDGIRSKEQSHDSNLLPINVVKVLLGCQGSAHDWSCAEAWSQQI